MKIKICGITNLQDAHYVLSLGADAIGFVFYPESKRYIKPEDAAEIIYTLPAFTLKVGVFVNAKVDKVNRVATQSGINIVQLHGEEPPDYVNDIAYPVIKTFRINDAFDFNILDNYSKCSFLLDTFDTSDYGGTGKTFNWNVIPDVLIKKIILAGGISEHNIEYIYNNLSPYAVDLSSSLESVPGKKDDKKLKSFFNKIEELRKNDGNIIKP